jgi:maltose O-acetyltransferase
MAVDARERRPVVGAMDRLAARVGAGIGRAIAARMLQDDALNATSRYWSWYVNSFAASSLLRGRERQAVYRQAGMTVDTDLIGPGCYFHTANVKIGAGALINNGCFIENVAAVAIGAGARLGMQVTVITSDHEIGPPEMRSGTWTRKPVSIGRGTWVGAGATILPGVSVGSGCVIAAGAVVNRDCEPNGLFAGVPAKRVRDLD